MPAAVVRSLPCTPKALRRYGWGMENFGLFAGIGIAFAGLALLIWASGR